VSEFKFAFIVTYFGIIIAALHKIGLMFGYNLKQDMFGWIPGALWEGLKWVLVHF
jgi:hypothetical protein